MQERKKKEYLIPLRMNSSSTVWASYCSSTSDFRSNGEAAVRCFGEFFAIFWFLIQFGSAGVNALIS